MKGMGLAAIAAVAIVTLSVPAVAAVTPFPASFRTQTIATNGTDLYVRVGGKGPAVVLLHGFGDTGDMWAPLAIVLAKDHTRWPFNIRPESRAGW